MPLQLAPEELQLLRRASQLQRLRNPHAEEIDVERLLQEIQHAGLHRLHRDGHGGLAGDDEDGRGHALLPKAAHHLHAVHAGQHVVGDD